MHSSIVEADRAAVWHPYTSRTSPTENIPVASTEGTHLHLTDGRSVIDGMSSWWAAAHGHGHPHLKQAAHRQIDQMSHVMFGGLTHRPATELATRLLTYCNAPGGGTPLDSVFFSDSGSVAVEVALKMALQYQRGVEHPHKTRFLTWRGGYHGDTQAPMALCDPTTGMHSMWQGVISQHVFADAPPPLGSDPETIETYIAELRALIDTHNAQRTGGIAGIIVEPLVQGAGGMRFHDPLLITRLRELCTETSTLLILDEIATGFGRTGHTLACHAAEILPDILCLGKALTGGFMSFAATLSTANVATAIDTPEGGGALMHGPTFMGNPLACAVSLAALDLIESDYWRRTVPRIESELCEGLQALTDFPTVADVRCLGAIGVIEMEQSIPMQTATNTLIDHGVWLRPFGKLLYTMPPFISTTEEIHRITGAMQATVERITA